MFFFVLFAGTAMAMQLFCFPGQYPGSTIYHGGNGYFYHKVNSRSDRKFTYLRCVHRDSAAKYCPGTAKALLQQNILFHLNNHTHSANVLYPQVKNLKRDIISRVKAGDQSPYHEIVQQEGLKYVLILLVL